ncbi:hypothetical protein [Leifsonia sp. Root112D2]|jgi:hypothetical protein|uniref:hypothetical protein n=1 Tax=Leifsonia sp. Root112D2 TaxID=1736426 RepID=UPI0006F4FBA1|nr:hypothetical protein [Leifsonia sp. Root112D2]KQV06623.1 hypothetical protein ASC63_04190 [Leifsonia sp. Root112D2]
MKTTLNLPDALFAAAKQGAAAEGVTMTSFVESALRARIAASGQSSEASVRLPTWRGGSADGYLIDVTDKDAVWAVLDERS